MHRTRRSRSGAALPCEPQAPLLKITHIQDMLPCDMYEKATSQDNTRQLEQKTIRASANKGRSNAWYSSH